MSKNYEIARLKQSNIQVIGERSLKIADCDRLVLTGKRSQSYKELVSDYCSHG